MKLHEFQSKNILSKKQLPVPKGMHITSLDQVADALQYLKQNRGVVKAQAYTGGRGKAGGVKLFTTEQEAHNFSKDILGMTLVTHQTGPQGALVESLLIEEATDISKELYVAIVLDRASIAPMLMASPDGGVDIEDIAENTPDRILKEILPIGQQLSSELCNRVADFLTIGPALYQDFEKLLNGLYESFMEIDAMMLEINPLVITGENKLSILDCKIDIDDNAAYRQLKIGADPNAEKTAAEKEASEWGMTYISLEGKIGCMVNGAGLAMATMDSIKHYGSEPANFLDVGGSASEEAVTKAFEIISSDKQVECIFVNIFGGIMKCDTIANGIVAAVNSVGLKFPLVIRLEGTNVELGKDIIKNSGLNLISADSLADGAKKAVETLNK